MHFFSCPFCTFCTLQFPTMRGGTPCIFFELEEARLKDAKETIEKLQSHIEHAESLTKEFIREKERNCARANNTEAKLQTIEFKLAIMGIRLENVLNMRNDDNIFCRCFKE